MDCARFEEVLHDSNRLGTHRAALRASALVHAESCTRCALLLLEARSLDFCLRTLAEETASKQAPPRIKIALLKEFRREKTASLRRRIQRQLTPLAAAAVVLMALGISFRHRPAFAPSPAPASTDAAAVNHTPQALAVVPKRDPAASKPLPAHSHALQNRPAESGLGEVEYTTAFVPLPYADDPETLEGGAIIRVTLPRSALASLGLPVSETASGERIPADLVLSEDGTPQAIRLVSQVNVNQ